MPKPGFRNVILASTLCALFAACSPPPCEEVWDEFDKTPHHYTLTLAGRDGTAACPLSIAFDDEDAFNPWVTCTTSQEHLFETDQSCTYRYAGTCDTNAGTYGASGAFYMNRDGGNATGTITYLYGNGSCTYDVLVQLGANVTQEQREELLIQLCKSFNRANGESDRMRILLRIGEHLPVLLAGPSVAGSTLLLGMHFGYKAAWLHPCSALLWVQCAGSMDELRKITGTTFSAGNLLGGCGLPST